MALCIKCGQQSTDDDYCSECGSKIGTATAIPAVLIVPPPPPISLVEGAICPDCGAPRNGTMRFCEVCCFDFQEKKSNAAAAEAPPTVVETVITAPVVPEEVIKEQITLSALPGVTVTEAPPIAIYTTPIYVNVSVDPTLDKDPDPSNPCPVNVPVRRFPLDLQDTLVGRRSPTRQIRPEIEVTDPAVSHRHLMFNRKPDNSIEAVDLNSTNGTIYNGEELLSGVPVVIKLGDIFVIGAWTKLEIVEK